MKKSILITIVVIACVAMAAPVVFAGTSFTSTSSTALGTVIFTPSTNVIVNAQSNGGSATSNPNTYCVTSWHLAAVNQSSGLQFAAISGGTTNPNTAIVTKAIGSGPGGCTQVDQWPGGATGWK